MTEVDKLKAQLHKAEQVERKAKLEKELKRLQDEYLDKCYATHTFQQKRTSMNFYIIWIKGINILDYDGEVKYEFDTESIHYRRDAKRYTSFDFSTGGSMDPRNSYLNFEHEIPKESYLAVKAQAHGNLDALFDVIRKNMNQKVRITIGEDSDEKTAEKLLTQSLSGKYVDTTKYSANEYNHTIRELLAWSKHPFLVGKYLVLNPLSKEILQQIISDLQNSARSWGNSIYGRDMPRAVALTKFLNAVKWD